MGHGLNPKNMADGARISALASLAETGPEGETIFVSRVYPYVGYTYVEGGGEQWWLKKDGWTAVCAEEAQAAVGYALPERTRKAEVAYFWKTLSSLTDAEWDAYTPDLSGTIFASKEDAKQWHRAHPRGGAMVLMSSENEFFPSARVFDSTDGCWWCFLGIPDIHTTAEAARFARTG